eukprot:jgi/Chrpa1/15769/Chrysochromulina_OHIO_Genome00005106-RA
MLHHPCALEHHGHINGGARRWLRLQSAHVSGGERRREKRDGAQKLRRACGNTQLPDAAWRKLDQLHER